MAAASDSIHPVAIEHLPMFITPPGETDVLMVVMAFILLVAVLAFGAFFFRLHSLPEHLAHKSDKIQAELVAVICLISLFTNMHIFWIIGLLLAMVELPDFGGPLNRIAGSAEKLAGFKPGDGDLDTPRYPGQHERAAAEETPPTDAPAKQAEAIPLPAREAAPSKHKGRAHA